MEITAAMIQDLRSKTGLGIMKCKEALKESAGDINSAIEYLRKKGMADASKKAHRTTSEGRIGYYIHHSGKLGVLVEVQCETDFVAKTDEFLDVGRDIAMHVASMNPIYVEPSEIPADVLEKEREIYRSQVSEMGNKPANIIEKIVEGKLTKFYSLVCLMDQPFVKDDSMTVRDYVKGKIAKLGENIIVRRFARIALGEEK
ncbi:elongation factor Ts [bacterium]|nr:elongation factor Ts [candidate division CSSED10-310 bacterium]